MMAGGVGGAYFGAKASVNFAADLRKDLFGKVQGYSFRSIDKFQTGSLVTRLTNDVTQMQNVVNMALRMMLRAPGMLIGALVMAILLQPKLSLVLAVVLPLMVIVVLLLIRAGFPRFSVMQEKVDKLNSAVQENVTNVRVVKSFVREDYEVKKFRKANRDLKKSGMSAMKILIFMSPGYDYFHEHCNHGGTLVRCRNAGNRGNVGWRSVRFYHLCHSNSQFSHDGDDDADDVLPCHSFRQTDFRSIGGKNRSDR